jgi:excisionase family DNA binding protein
MKATSRDAARVRKSALRAHHGRPNFRMNRSSVPARSRDASAVVFLLLALFSPRRSVGGSVRRQIRVADTEHIQAPNGIADRREPRCSAQEELASALPFSRWDRIPNDQQRGGPCPMNPRSDRRTCVARAGAGRERSRDDVPAAARKPTLTVREAADVLGVNVKTLYAEITAGRFPAIRLGRAIRISRSVVASSLEQGCVAPSGGRNGGTTR